MNEAHAIIIASIITVGGMLANFIINLFVNKSQRKEDSKERFFYEMYQRRLVLYEDVFKTLETIGKPENYILGMTADEFGSLAVVYYQTIMTLINRLRVFGSKETKDVLETAKTELAVLLQNDLKIARGIITGNFIIDVIDKLKAVVTFDRKVIKDFIILLADTQAAFSECVERETGTNFVDDRINEVLKRFAKKKKNKKLHRKHNAPINEQCGDGLPQDKKDETNGINS